MGKCIPVSRDCKLENECTEYVAQNVKEEAGKCEAYSCTATDCDKCKNNDLCMWSQSRKRQSE